MGAGGQRYNASLVTTRGRLIAAAPTSATVDVTSAIVVPANANRAALVLCNTSVNVISLGFDGNAAVLNSGITLQGGAIFSMDEYAFSLGAVTAIADVASSNLGIQEFT